MESAVPNSARLDDPARPAEQQANLKPRVLVVENDLEVREANITKLQYWNFEPVVATGWGRALLADARVKAREHRCHLALVDMHLLDDYDHEDWSGLHLGPDLLPTRTIIYSGSCNYQAVRGALSQYQALDFVGKSEGPEYLREVLDRHAERWAACRRPLQIRWPEEWSSARVAEIFSRDTRVPPDEADDILAGLFPRAARLELNFLSGHNPSSQSLPRPRSLVMQAREDGGQPVIVKLAFYQKMQQEVDNYEQYIKKNLVGSYRPNLQSHYILWDLGGAVYSFVGLSERIIPFSNYYATAKPRPIKNVLSQFFKVTWSPLYRQVVPHPGGTLFEAYCQVWRGEWWLQRLAEHHRAGRVPPLSELWPRAAELRLPDPVDWLVRRAHDGLAGNLDSIPMAVTHGDLHSENLLVDTSNQNAWVIDFERTGEGPLLQDFVELESDLINHLVMLNESEDDLFYALCCAAAAPARLGRFNAPREGDPRLVKALDVISFLRKVAAEATGVTDAQDYLWGVLFNALFRSLMLINSSGPRSQLARALLLAAIMCHRLDAWGEPWPPPGWPAPNEIIRRSTGSLEGMPGLLPDSNPEDEEDAQSHA